MWDLGCEFFCFGVNLVRFIGEVVEVTVKGSELSRRIGVGIEG